MIKKILVSRTYVNGVVTNFSFSAGSVFCYSDVSIFFSSGSAIKQWFMYSIGGNNNEQPVRVVLRKQNFSILDHQLIVLHYHSLQSLEFQEFLINPCNGIINMSITEASETAGEVIKVKVLSMYSA